MSISDLINIKANFNTIGLKNRILKSYASSQVSGPMTGQHFEKKKCIVNYIEHWSIGGNREKRFL